MIGATLTRGQEAAGSIIVCPRSVWKRSYAQNKPMIDSLSHLCSLTFGRTPRCTSHLTALGFGHGVCWQSPSSNNGIHEDQVRVDFDLLPRPIFFSPSALSRNNRSALRHECMGPALPTKGPVRAQVVTVATSSRQLQLPRLASRTRGLSSGSTLS